MAKRDSEENTAFLGYKTPPDADERTNRFGFIQRMLQKNIVWGVLGFISSSFLFLAIILMAGYPRDGNTKPQLLASQSLWPDIPEYTRVFVDDKDWKDDGEVGDVLWNNLLPIGEGYVPIPYPRNYNLPESAPFVGNPDKAEVYATSSVHQLHCLATLREMIKSYDRGEVPAYGSGHAYHCLNYLRQGVLCAADTTFEYGHPVWDAEGKYMSYDFSGIGGVHQCRDWNTVKEFLVNHRASDKQSIN
ncbi:hypothetical protein VHEMI07076 [[Torrubiella] hemipterigena]|uniref:Tat pathway signal sequence n=1 Tax=[Torrubiella] hemipterigena TaxID=1531966 RepID=A0A0A1TL02_9HYPO|nr:hypothetical protein VHEMI07076 [[Torrubiella] hemipterigena]